MSDATRVWRGWCAWLSKSGNWETGGFSHTPMITTEPQEFVKGTKGYTKLKNEEVRNIEVVLLPAADYDALVAELAAHKQAADRDGEHFIPTTLKISVSDETREACHLHNELVCDLFVIRMEHYIRKLRTELAAAKAELEGAWESSKSRQREMREYADLICPNGSSNHQERMEILRGIIAEVERLRAERDLLIARWPTDDKPVVSVTST